MAGTDPCVSSWAGIDCDLTGNVIILNLTHVGLNGPIPKALGRLTSLVNLDLGNNKVCKVCSLWNHVTGDLAPLTKLVNLETLILTSNEMSLSSFPTAVFQLKKLSNLYLGNNSFTGTIPEGVLGSLTNLKELTIWGNALAGLLPAELGNLVNLTYLNLNKNNLYGGLPPELGKLTLLRKL